MPLISLLHSVKAMTHFVYHLCVIVQEAKLRELLDVSTLAGKMENRMLTVVSGPDMVNITYLNFMAFTEDTAKVNKEQRYNSNDNCPITVCGINV